MHLTMRFRKFLTAIAVVLGLLVLSAVPAKASVVAGCGGNNALFGNSSAYTLKFNGFDGCTNTYWYMKPGNTNNTQPWFDAEYVWTDYCWAILVRVSTMRADGQWRTSDYRTLNWTTSGGDGWSKLADGWELYDFYDVVPSGFC